MTLTNPWSLPSASPQGLIRSAGMERNQEGRHPGDDAAEVIEHQEHCEDLLLWEDLWLRLKLAAVREELAAAVAWALPDEEVPPALPDSSAPCGGHPTLPG
jgi:hypothetical protein